MRRQTVLVVCLVCSALCAVQGTTDVLCNSNVTCPAGTQALGTSTDCSPCPLTTFKADNSSSCCKFCLPPAVLANATTCTCPASYFWSVGKVLRTCKRCPSKTYSPSANALTCSTCAPGTVLNAARTGCECPAGQQATGTAGPGVVTGCAACGDGLVNPNPTTAADACKPCPFNATRANAITCLCPAATLMVKDAAGYAQACLPCPDGAVMPDLHASTTCFPCKNGAVATPMKTQCLCPPGRYVEKFGNKMPSIPGFDPRLWGPKFLSIDSGNWGSWSTCKTCPKDKITVAPNLDRACLACSDPLVSDDSHTLCIQLCPDGTENIGNLTDPVCQNCSSTSVNPRQGGNCTACPADKVANAARSKCVCPAGFYPTGGGCTKCPFTKTNTVPGGGCRSCPFRLASTNGITCDTCDLPYFNSAAAGATPKCTTCAAGYYRPLKKVEVCTVCFGDTLTPDNNTWQLCCRNGTVFNATAEACV